MKKKFKVGELVWYPYRRYSNRSLCLIVEVRDIYYRLKDLSSEEYYNTTEQWIALPTYSPTPMGLQVNAHTVIKGL